jgi:two-component system response regulator VicR
MLLLVFGLCFESGYHEGDYMPKRILVIDDEEDILEILDIVFQEEGYEVILSNTGEAADHIQITNPDLILMDVRLSVSGESGAEICSRIKSHYETRKLPIILVSAETDLPRIAKECGADAFLPKPFDIFQLLIQVKEFIT